MLSTQGTQERYTAATLSLRSLPDRYFSPILTRSPLRVSSVRDATTDVLSGETLY